MHVLSEHTERTIQSIDSNLEGIVAELEAAPKLDDNDARFRAELRRRLNSLPYVRALFIIDADGFISHDTDYPETPRVSLADRAYFKAHQDNPMIKLQVGNPLQSRSLGVWFISLSRRIEHADGSFAGIVVAAMEPLYFEHFYRQLWVGSGTIGLFLNDGTLLARSPRDQDIIGSSFATSEPFSTLLHQDRQSVFWINSPIDGVSRVAGYRVLYSVPLVMLVAMNEDEVMRPWRSHTTVAVVGAALVLIMLTAIEWLSRRNRQREQRAQARLMEAERLESIGRFAGGVAHDVGNLLHVVRSAVLLLRPQVVDRPKAEGILDQIDDTIAVGGKLVNELLFYARAEHCEPQDIDLDALLAETLPMLRRAAGPRVDIRVFYAGSNVTCLSHVAQFQATLLNLILNARDAMPDGGTISIDIRSVRDEEGEWGEISFADNGRGMSPDVLQRAFDPFFTTKEGSTGHGLGLSQVRAFAEFSKGTLAVESEEGKGTTVRLRLPIAAETGPGHG